jgi:uncharacterized repeat protein (TIGR01451 family)
MGISMKTNYFKGIKVSILLLIFVLPSLSIAGVFPDLSFGGAANPPDVTEGNELSTTVFFTVNNATIEPALASDTNLTVTFDSFFMSFDDLSVDPTPFDNCSASGNVVTCSCLSTCGGVFDNTAGVTIGLPFNLSGFGQPLKRNSKGVPIPTPAGMYDFDATLSNSFSSPNPIIMTTKTLNVLGVPVANDPDVVIDMDIGPEFFPGGKGSLLAPIGSIVTYKILVDAIDTLSGSGTKNSQGIINGIPAGPANNVVISHMIPAGLTFQSFSNIVGPNLAGACSESARMVTCNIASLPITTAEDSVEISVLVGGTSNTLFELNSMVSADNDIDPNNNSVQINGIFAAAVVDLTIDKQSRVVGGGAQSTFEAGDNFEYVLTVTNDNSTNEDINQFDVTVIDDVPSGLIIGNFIAPAGWDCGSTNLQANHIECRNSMSFDANTSAEFIIPVSTLNEDQYINSASVDLFTFSSIVELNTGNNISDTTVDIGTQTTLSVDVNAVKSGVIVPSISSGSDFTYRVAIENTGLFDANMIDLIDEMPSGVTINSITGAGWTCTNSGLDQLCDFPGPLAPGATTFLNFNVTESGAGIVLTNLINAQAANAPLVSDFVNIDVTNVTFDVNITQNPDPIEEAQPFELIVDIINTGSEAIIGTEIRNTLPEGFSYTNQSKSSTCIVTGQDMVCTVDDPIAIGSTESVSIGIQAIEASDSNVVYSNSITVSGTNIPSPINVQTVTNVNPVGAGSGTFNYTVALNDSTDPNELNTPFDYVVTIENTGSSHITFMDVDVGIPSELTTNSMITSGFICTSASFGLSCNSDQSLNIAPGDSLDVITVNVQSNSFVGDVLADVIANLGTVLQRTNNETTTIIDSQVDVSDISVEIVAGADIDQGAVSEFEVKIANSGPNEAEEVVLDMSVSGILDSISVVSGSEWTCQVNNLNINCQFNSSTMPIGHQSSIFVTANTTLVVVDAENLVLSATLTTSSEDSNLTNNTATSEVNVSGTPLEGEIGEALRGALGSSGNPQLDSAIDGISGFCELAFYTAIDGLCSALYDAALSGDTETVLTAIDQIMPNEVIGQSTSVSEIATAQFRNIGARLSQVRGGGGSGFSTAGLNARYGNSSIPLGMLAYLNQTEDEANGIDTNNDFISPWGFFVNGTISMGDRDATSKELAFDFDTFGLTAGVDYRLDAKKVIGVALGYAKFDSTIENVSELNSSGITLTGYGSFYITDNLYLDTRVSYARPDFDQSRRIDFTLGSTHIDRTAIGNTDADQFSVAMSAGYSFYKNAWNITPNASINYVKTTINEFTETGAGDFNFVYLEQELDSLVWSAGIRVSKAISLKNGVISPQFDLDYNYEGLNDGKDIQARFVNAPEDQMLIVVTDSPDRSYGTAGIGLVFISANGKQAYINYRSVLGLEGFSRGTFNLGARFEF